ncbi:MAG TPA: hypothetical protein VKQ06_03540, partial [Gammaproteobacteria bacterium]|nr:hypothetical protein [Gammaproteobacteria bacterium]
HSLGGRATYMALRPIMQRFIDRPATVEEPVTDEEVVPSLRERIADVTVFANPAFSAVEHKSLQRMMSSIQPESDAIPRFIMLTSESDQVLRRAFQVSQKMKSFLRGDYGLSDPLQWTAAGHHLPYLTHRLSLEGGSYSNPEGDGDCPGLSANELEIVKGGSRVQYEQELYNFAVIQHYEDDEEAYRTTLRRVSGGAGGGEAMVIEVDEQIIPNHNDIFTTPSVDFIVRVLNCSYNEPACTDALANLDEIPEDGGAAP